MFMHESPQTRTSLLPFLPAPSCLKPWPWALQPGVMKMNRSSGRALACPISEPSIGRQSLMPTMRLPLGRSGSCCGEGPREMLSHAPWRQVQTHVVLSRGQGQRTGTSCTFPSSLFPIQLPVRLIQPACTSDVWKASMESCTAHCINWLQVLQDNVWEQRIAARQALAGGAMASEADSGGGAAVLPLAAVEEDAVAPGAAWTEGSALEEVVMATSPPTAAAGAIGKRVRFEGIEEPWVPPHRRESFQSRWGSGCFGPGWSKRDFRRAHVCATSALPLLVACCSHYSIIKLLAQLQKDLPAPPYLMHLHHPVSLCAHTD